ncbi:type II toxin-antitoxin system VapC family toxin [Humisphaera borealis]|uniref:Ribonuclease VapC n=1 Tax=Humisphaera borealis TaxID=2807512 RepID=A0A7M2X5K9_9BACT|nr:type II toxin-antitoxin system VapC family toxin [Humisphaera borealis]QOV92090.1 type II toxin-antitoxin system VapC family toxin [Humisphaera borealis]
MIDASVAVKWLIPEAHHERAQALIVEGHQLIAPSHIGMEVLGAVVRKFRMKQLEPSEVARARQSWAAMIDEGVIELVDAARLMEAAVNIAIDLRHSLADCLYVALAGEVSGTLMTFDRLLCERGRQRCTVRLLGIDD